MVTRAVAVLMAVRVEDGVVGVVELSRRTGLPKSTVSRLVGELVDAHLLERDGHAVRLGVRLFELGERAGRPRDLRRAAAAPLSDLHRATGHTVHLAVLEGVDVVYISLLHGRHGPPIPSRVGGRMPAYATGVGKAMLAYAEQSVLDAVIGAGLRKVGPRSITAPTTLRAELGRIRTVGIAYEREESAANVGCAASPILDAAGAAVAAVSVTGWSGRLDVRRVGPAVKLTSLAVSRRLPPHTD